MTVAVENAAGRAGVPSGGPGPAIWLGGRFRLDERVTTADGLSVGQGSLWRATDALLGRPVAIHLLSCGVRVPAHVMAAVQAAARVNDPRLATIYDTDYDIEGPYIVSEWTPGTPARTCRGVYTCPWCRGAAGSAVGSSPGQHPVSRA